MGFDCWRTSWRSVAASSTLRTPTTIYSDLYLPLHGRHQGDNAAVALTAAEAFFDAPLAQDVVEEAFAAVRCPAASRCSGTSRSSSSTAPTTRRAPTAAPACCSRTSIRSGKKILVVGFLAGRDPTTMLEALRADEMDAVICCTPGTSRAHPGRRGRPGGAGDRLRRRRRYTDSVADACDAALARATAEDLVLVTGSLYVVGHARPHLRPSSAYDGVASASDDPVERGRVRGRAVAWPLAMPDRTLVICKPDAVERGLVGAILEPLRAAWPRHRRPGAADARRGHPQPATTRSTRARRFYAELVAFMSRGPVVPAAIEGPEDTWKVVRDMMGATNPRNAAPGTIRGDLGIQFTENLIHGSDSAESADRGTGLFFPGL